MEEILKLVQSMTQEEKAALSNALSASEPVEEETQEKAQAVEETKQPNVDNDKTEDLEKEVIEEEVVDTEKGNLEKLGEDVEKPQEEEVVEETGEEVVEEEALEEPQVEMVEESGMSHIRVEDIVTKDELEEKFAAFEAKNLALVKENEDLKKQVEGMSEKYERKDFGNQKTIGAHAPSKPKHTTFDEYASEFRK